MAGTKPVVALPLPFLTLNFLNMTRKILSLILVLMAAGCTKPDSGDSSATSKINLTLNCESIVVSSSAAQKTVTVTSDGDWGVSAQDRSWLSVSPSGGGKGTSEVLVKISENTTGDVRESNIVFRTKNGQLSLPVRQNYEVEEVVISDAGFKAALLESYDVDGDGILSTKEAAVVTEIKVSGRGIKAMPELNEVFTKVTYLDCSDNQLEELDITHLLGLEVMNATGNPGLKTIYVWSGFKEPDGFSKPETAEYVEPEISTPAGYELVWQEEFNESATGLPDMKRWWYETGAGGWGNNELQDYVSGTYNGEKIAKVEDGRLTITATKIDGKVRSIRVNTIESWTYGYFEARLKLPKGKGTWPAFWMMPKNFTAWPKDGEIDIMEHVGYHQDYVSSSIHCTAYVHSNGTQKTKEIYLKGATDEFHVYALEWTPEYIKSYVDGVQLFYYKPETYGERNYNTWPFDNPFYLKLNLAWGGNWGGAMGIDENCLPAVYEIDYVRVFQKFD